MIIFAENNNDMKQLTQKDWIKIYKIMVFYNRKAGWISWIKNDNGDEEIRFFDAELKSKICALITIKDVKHAIDD